MVGSLLLVMLAVEGATLLSLRSLLSVHVFVGIALIAPVALKLASAGYRFVRYYTHDPAYVRAGPPATILRVLAPLVIAATVILLASGVALVALGHRNDAVLGLHKASFVVWLVLTSIHVLGHLRSLPRLLRGHAGATASPSTMPRRRTPMTAVLLVVGVLGVGIVAGALSLPAARGFQREHRGSRHDRDVRLPGVQAPAVSRSYGPLRAGDPPWRGRVGQA